jgi:YVTN family beta-propeller protein
MQFSVLGPLEVSLNGAPDSIGGRKQRTLLAMLLLHANETVSRDRLVEALWRSEPPPSAAESLDTYVYRLRKLLGHDRLVREAGGYRLRVQPGELDVEQFERLVASAARSADAGDDRPAASALTEALALWRGLAWGELVDEPSVTGEAQRLEEMRLSAVESRIEAKLGQGEGLELVAELDQLVTEHPLRERLLAGLMIALYRAGRQADALGAFQAARQRLIEELGLEPGPSVYELQRRILQHDPSLGAPRRRLPVVVSRGRWRVAVGVLLGVAAVLIGGFVLSAGVGSRRPALSAGASGIVAVQAATGRVVAATTVVGTPAAVSGGDGAEWVAAPGAEEVSEIDPRTGGEVQRIGVGGEPGSIVTGGGAVWVASSVGATVTRIDPTTQGVTQTLTLPGTNLGAMAYGAGRLWVADSVEDDLFEIDPTTGSLKRTFALDLQPSAIAVAGGAIWVAGYASATVEELNPVSGRVIGRVHVGDGPAALAFDGGSLWVANSLDATISRIDPATLSVTATIPVGSGPTALASAGGSVWVANEFSDTLSRIDPRRDRVAAEVSVAGTPTSLAASGRVVWVAVAATGGSHRGGTLVIVTPQSVSSSNFSNFIVDPAFYDGANNSQFAGLAYDSLVTFQQSPGANGLRLVPDLALSIPRPTDGDRSYAFRVRPGIRYSNGQLLRAGDFRRGVERLFRDRSQAASFLYAGLLGATACLRHPHGCELSRGIVTDHAAGTVTFHFTSPDPEFLFQLTEYAFSAPVPPGTPDRETGSRTVPGTRPYEIASASSTEVRFVRNPFFREWSHAAQPAGNPDAIVWRTVPTAQAAVTAIEHGRADWLYGPVPPAQYHSLELQAPAQLHSNPQFAVEFAPINTRVAPFNDVRVRQALNYAINRAKIAQLYGGPSFATPTCQPIAPGLPGYRRYCPYTRRPQADGAWSAPNMARARHLIAQSGTSRERVDVWGSPDEGFIPPPTTAYVAGVLRALGYRVHEHLVPIATITQAMWDRFQISVDGDWLANYPDPSSYIPAFFSCGGGNSNGYYCNPPLDREMDQAELSETNNPAKARSLWESVDRQLTNDAVWAPTVTTRDVELTSNRLRNYEYNPAWGFLADQAWLR